MDELKAQGIGLAAISYDAPEILAEFSQRHGITYPLLSDLGSAIIKKYGILNTVADEALGPNGDNPDIQEDVRRYVTVTQASERFQGVPFPGTFMLDGDGRVTARFLEEAYQERNTVSSILMRVGASGPTVQANQISTNHLKIKTYPSDSAIAAGHHFTIAAEIEPLPEMHVYAPGADGYRVISLRIDPQPFVRLSPIDYPDSEIYYFEPLDERVPVYQEPFTLLQEVIPEASSQEAQDAFGGIDQLTLTGSLEYQACDDRICYNPVSVPLTWTLDVKPFVPR